MESPIKIFLQLFWDKWHLFFVYGSGKASDYLDRDLLGRKESEENVRNWRISYYGPLNDSEQTNKAPGEKWRREPNTGINQRACSLHTTTKVGVATRWTYRSGKNRTACYGHEYAPQVNNGLEGERNSCKSLNLRACSTQQLRWVWLQGENIGPAKTGPTGPLATAMWWGKSH